ncbi:CYTH and CHAD domain-containing protein [Blastococcus sp. CT_GayMR16]|uniref:CYTH and CHAD domain-containing protein n=1 Tax=Blastococcus sp. CT_GayMR16 TaxID=2559607 RepID=UPI001073C450|nr:CYTH and CHAD domain-containing protein [Blastococcus sp. CT_GayMR16]TFV85731.1 CYTH and CHAD domain-containing protein [Blastococcus sp. CT_GayMR16]
MTSGHLEVETKYEVEAGFAVPPLNGLPGVATVDEPVEHLLEAVYLDTDDLRLLRARVTLRRRTGGPDAGWHLKLPAGNARRELHAPLGRATKNPPRALQEPVVGILRGARPRPVTTLRTRRLVTALRAADGALLAEIADDTVTATLLAGPDGAAEVHAWREVEVELGADHGESAEALAAAVGERLVAVGARPSPSASKVGRVLAGRLAALPTGIPVRDGERPTAGEFLLAGLTEQVAGLQAADVLLRTEQPDAVHQVRVAARRLRSTLAAFHDVLERSVTEPVRAELSWLGGQLADARDSEVALEHLRAVVAAEPDELLLGPVAARLQQTELREVRAGLDRALLTLSEARYLRLLDDLHALLDAPPFTARADEALKPVLRDTTRRSVRRLRRHLATARRATGHDRAEALHGVRKAAKRARYAAEVGRGELAHVKALARAAKKVQTVLGELQDTVVTREQCRRLGIVAFAAGENTFTYGRLHGLEQNRGERAEQEFWALAKKVGAVLKAAE